MYRVVLVTHHYFKTLRTSMQHRSVLRLLPQMSHPILSEHHRNQSVKVNLILTILMFMFWSSSIFCGFKSRCITSLVCRYASTWTICAVYILVTSIESLLRLAIMSAKSPFSQFSKMKNRKSSSCATPSNLMMKGWSNSNSKSFSLKTDLVLPTCYIYCFSICFIATI